MGTNYLQRVAKCDKMESVSHNFCASMERIFLLWFLYITYNSSVYILGKEEVKKCTKDVQKALLVT